MAEKKTIQDVAAVANVSIATVSRVINHFESVSESTKERVFSAMRKVGYQLPETKWTGPAARKNTILIMITNIGNIFTGLEVDGIFSAAYDAGYECMIYRQKSRVYRLEEMRSLVESVNACGVLMSLPNVQAEIMTELAKLCSVVQFSEYAEDCAVPYVSVDDFEVGWMATNYLLKQGCRKIAMINGPQRFKYAREREAGYRAALREAGLEQEAEVFRLTDGSFDSVISMVNQVLTMAKSLDAVYAVGDPVGVSFVRAASMCGLRVPEDIAVISSEDTPWTLMCNPSLTSIHQPVFNIGEMACKMLIEQMNGQELSVPQVKMKVNLVVRESA